MTFGCKMNNGLGPILLQKCSHEFFIRDVSVNKNVARVAFKRAEVFEVPCIGKAVKIEDRGANVPKPFQHKTGATTASPASYQDRTVVVAAHAHPHPSQGKP